MSEDTDLLHERINLRGEIESLRTMLSERERFDAERDRRYEQRFTDQEKALRLQAIEYERRLHDLNGEYKRDRERQKDYVTVDKFEDNLKAEKQARELALERITEKHENYVEQNSAKLEEFVTRYEQDKRDLDVLLAAQKAAAETAKQAALDEGRRIRETTNAQARKFNRNLAVVAVALPVIVIVVNVTLALLR